jgi:hypothetical protein
VVFAVVDDAVNVTVGFRIVITPTGPMVILGLVISWVTVMESFFVQPLTLFLAVTIYLPGVATDTGSKPPVNPVQVKVVLAVVVDASKLTDVVEHVKVPVGAIERFGFAIS